MRGPGTPTLDQLTVLLAVVEEGGFTAAARRLRRATSAVSYAIDTLERQLGLSLFDRGTTRRPKLTPAGEAVVAEAKSVVHGAEMLLARVKGLMEGLEAELSLAVDSMFPTDWLADVLKAFHAQFPTVPLRLKTEPLGGIERLVRDGRASIGVGGLMHTTPEGLDRVQIGAVVPMIPVAAPDHPLTLAHPAPPGATRDHLQLVLSEMEAADDRDYGVVAVAVWRLGDLVSKHALLVAGVGWGGMPEPMVRADLKAGRLKRLDLSDWRGGDYQMLAIHRTDTPPGPAGRWLIERLAETCTLIE